MGFWDLCATDALFREIGGGCLNLKGREIDYTFAQNKEIHKYDIMIGDNQNQIQYYLKQYNNLLYRK
jgi:hypothetical protein